MFRVPTSADNPTFDDTFKVSFWKWLGSKKHDRGEWMRRRNAGAKFAERNQIQRQKEARDAARAQWADAKPIMKAKKTR